MDLFQFINSRDIEEHLKAIDYKLSTMEAAWLVWQCTHVSFAQKHEAWEHIIHTMPDCAMIDRPNMTARPRLHSFLRDLMDFESRQFDQLKATEPGVVYHYVEYYPSDSYWSIDNDDLSSSFDLCKEKVMTYLQKSVGSTRFSLSDYRFRISKIWVDSIKRTITAEFDGEGELLSIVNYGDRTDDEEDLIYYGFEGMWFAFPTPFNEGDVVCRRGYENAKDLWEVPFVLDHVLPEGKVLDRLKKNGDCSDMTAYGYFQNPENGEIYCECMHHYMELEYYRGDFSGARRALKALSNFLKGEISVDLYTRAYRTILEEEHLRTITPVEGWFTKEGLSLAGLRE